MCVSHDADALTSRAFHIAAYGDRGAILRLDAANGALHIAVHGDLGTLFACRNARAFGKAIGSLGAGGLDAAIDRDLAIGIFDAAIRAGYVSRDRHLAIGGLNACPSARHASIDGDVDARRPVHDAVPGLAGHVAVFNGDLAAAAIGINAILGAFHVAVFNGDFAIGGMDFNGVPCSCIYGGNIGSSCEIFADGNLAALRRSG